jgi:chromosome segregation ATPase
VSQTPVTVTYSLEEVFKQINSKLDQIQSDVNEVKIEQAALRGEINTLKSEIINLKEEVKDIKGAQKAQIWALIGILTTAVGGFLVFVARYVFFNPS